ncbi:2Fe-2S iron-sulfur cluster binding domain protein [uncultured archaeon]|nr:2Fe-2S iron-sulfur cluster binding domain protein [uncultured archaeon]
MASIEVDGKSVEVKEGSSIKDALEALGFKIAMFPSQKGFFMPCQTGGCWSCALEIDGQLMPVCIGTVQKGMRIKTDTSSSPPKRMVGGFMGHHVGGVGTPWWLCGDWIEVACFTAGCNFCCPQCQNWRFAYLATGDPLTPPEAAKLMTATRRRYAVERIAISGGEGTLNRRWLIQYLRLLQELNPGARLHDLVDAGMTEIGIDLKALRLSTFQEGPFIFFSGLSLAVRTALGTVRLRRGLICHCI